MTPLIDRELRLDRCDIDRAPADITAVTQGGPRLAVSLIVRTRTSLRALA